MTSWYLAFRYLGSVRRFFNLSTSLSVLGMVIGVSSLVVSMAVFSGYVSTLEQTVQDAVGHLLVGKRGSADQEQMLEEIQPLVTGLVARTPFVYSEAILAHQGKVGGVLIEGIEAETFHKVLNLKPRLISGSLDLTEGSDPEAPKVLIGKRIAQKYGLKVGDVFRLVVPLNNEFDSGSFRPKLGRFTVAGVINFGRYDFDARYVMMDLQVVQEFVEIGKKITGYRLRLEDPYKARAVAYEIATRFPSAYWSKDWQDVNRNLFEAAKLEKAVLFFVLMILVVAAAFNIANTLFISVVQRYRDISVLKTMGAPDAMIRQIFAAQGLIVGAVGAVLGIIVGLLLCQFLEWLLVAYDIIPAEVYKLDRIDLDVRGSDLLAILVVSLFICFIATLVPSRRGARITPVEGLRYE